MCLFGLSGTRQASDCPGFALVDRFRPGREGGPALPANTGVPEPHLRHAGVLSGPAVLPGSGSFSAEGPHASFLGRVSSSSCHRSHTAWRVAPRAVAISAQDKPAFRAYRTVLTSVLSQVWRTSCMAFSVVATSAFQPCGLDRDTPVTRGPFIAR